MCAEGGVLTFPLALGADFLDLESFTGAASFAAAFWKTVRNEVKIRAQNEHTASARINLEALGAFAGPTAFLETLVAFFSDLAIVDEEEGRKVKSSSETFFSQRVEVR